MTTKNRLLKTLTAVLLSVFLLTACSANSSQTSDDKISVLSTTTIINDMASIIGGEFVEAVSLMGSGVDPHTYQASAGDVDLMTNSDIVIYNGYNLEAQLGELIKSLENQDKYIICVENALDDGDVILNSEDENAVDPHVWNDVSLWIKLAYHVAECFSEYDPDNAEYYNANMQSYVLELEELEQYIINCTAEIPEEQRIIISAHDAFGYLSSAYGYTVRGLQGLSTETEASTADVIELADFIVENEVKVLFTETAINTKSVEALQEAVTARGWSVEIVETPLYSDYLGDESTNTETYIKMMKHNIDTITNALGRYHDE